MERFVVAVKALWLIINNKQVSVNIKSRAGEIQFESGCFAKTAEFLRELKKKDNMPDYILNQYKELLMDAGTIRSDEY